MARKKLLHLKSSVVNQDGTPKLPSSEQIELGEIAVNYAEGYETLAIKNSNNEIIPFTNSITMMNYVDEAISGAVSGINEVSVVYSGETPPTSASTIEIFVDENLDPEEVDVYTKDEVDDIVSGATEDMKEYVDEAISGATLDEEVGLVYSGETPPTSASTIKLFVDENTDAEVEVYTKEEVNDLIADVVDISDEPSGYTATMVVDESTDVEVDFYSKGQVDNIIVGVTNDLKAYVDSAMTATSVVQTTGTSTTQAMSQSAVTYELSSKLTVSDFNAYSGDVDTLLDNYAEKLDKSVSVSSQTFTEEEKTQARVNIDAVGVNDLTTYATQAWVNNQHLEARMVITTADSTSLTAEVNKYYRYDSAVGTLAITLPTPSDATYLSSIVFSFTTSSSSNVTFTSSSTIKYQDGFEIENSTSYEINAVYNGSYWALAAIIFTT